MSNKQSKTIASKSAISLSEHVLLPACKSYVENKAKEEAEAKRTEKLEPGVDTVTTEKSQNSSSKAEVLKVALATSESAAPAFKKYLEGKGKTNGKA